MKVLMFGWEFPPHISGGLGTACYGLTQSLSRSQQVQILFVVPRLFGDEPAEGSVLISASTVGNAVNGRTQSGSKTAGSRIASDPMPTTEHPQQLITYLGIPSFMTPYQQPTRNGGSTLSATAIGADRDSHRFHSDHRDERHPDSSDGHSRENSEGPEMTGMYGNNLLSEVERYGKIGGLIAQQHSFDIIHAHDWMTFPAGIAAKRTSKKPLVIHVHSTEFDRAGDHVNETVVRIEREGFHAADKIIAVSNWTKQIITSRYNISSRKITVVHNGISPRKEQDEFVFPDIGSHFVTFLGRVTHQKGPWFFVEAASKVLQEFPDAHFIVAGAGDLLPQTIEQVAQLNMSSQFHFTGFLSGSQVDQIWSLTDVYVMPSVSEPFGIAPLEAIQRGVPVILSRQSGVSEVMPHAITVDFWNVNALAAAICSVLRYESLSHLLRHNSKNHIKHLTWNKAARGVKAVYDELTKKK